MCDELGSERLLDEDGFFARLLGRSPSGAGREALYEPDLPVVLLTGGPGMGKGRLLRAVRDRFAAKVPVIYLDCGSPVYADRAEPEPGARSAATEVLAETARRLSTWQGTGGSFTFPRLFAGLAVIATQVAEGTPDAVTAEVQRYEELLQRQRLRGLGTGDFWRGALRGAVRNLLTTLSVRTLDPYAASVSTALVDALFDGLAPRGRTELARIYGAYPGAAGQPDHGLRDLAADFRAGGEERELAESFLFRALREDLEAAYAGTVGWLRRVGRPAVLLDRAETPLGEQLLRAVLTDRRGGRRDRVVVVGTARRADGGAFLYGGLPPRELPPPAEFRPADGVPPTWSRRAGSGTERAPLADGVLLLRMPLLTADQVRLETERRHGPHRARLPAEPGGLPDDARVRRHAHHRHGTAPGAERRRRPGARPGGRRQGVVTAPVPAPGAGHERPDLPDQRRKPVRQAGRGRRAGSGPCGRGKGEVRRPRLAHRPGPAEELRHPQPHALTGTRRRGGAGRAVPCRPAAWVRSHMTWFALPPGRPGGRATVAWSPPRTPSPPHPRTPSPLGRPGCAH
ncbi:hypothetical protein ACE1SV_02210 [Streptomyces sp. E-15]